MTAVESEKYLTKFIAFHFLLIILFIPILGHTAPVQLNNQIQHYTLGPNVEYLLDNKSNLSIKEVTSSAKTSFRQNNTDTLRLGYTDSTVWIRVDIDASRLVQSAEKWIIEVDFPPLDNLTFFKKNDLGKHVAIQTGDFVDFSQRDIKTTSYAFEIDLSPKVINTFHFRVQGQNSMRIPINLYTQSAYLQRLDLKKVNYGLYGGIIFAMVLYNLFLFASTRDRSYLYCVLYVSSFVLYQINLSGLGQQYLWPSSPWWTNQSPAFGVACISIFGPLFTINFLDTKSYTPFIHKILRCNVFIASGLAVWSLLANNYSDASNPVILLALITLTMTFATGIINLLRKNQLARFFLVASSVLIVGGITESMSVIGIIPSGFMTNSASLLGTCMFSLILSFALADRANILRQQKTVAEQKTKQQLMLANRNLTRSNQIKNDFLATVSHELRTPMNRIIECLDFIKRTETSDPATVFLRSGSGAAEEMVLMIEELLGFSEIETVDTDLITVETRGGNPVTDPVEDSNKNKSRNKVFDILIVEDNPVDLMLLSSILKKLNYRVHTATNGQEALNFAYVEHADCILMDLNMPTMDGLNAATTIRHLDSYIETPIIAISSKLTLEYKHLCISAGMNDFLKKPVNVNSIRLILDKWLKYGGVMIEQSNAAEPNASPNPVSNTRHR